ncbi:hypothetical protein [Dethiobacter alkaliphilus]|uniref:Methionyl-tRNA formyltransferase n=1 Tax=Dethiobacter alkaliphilus AHT 1 TaxID=555088 RepID=C0GD46_DETAL|nr:hypothetical protein [Dethiobacter alkaliphilus]EEG79131.1 hypothetical protein DealDRAFT_0405 [Dethiobacter alkaliphilus AHT 1]
MALIRANEFMKKEPRNQRIHGPVNSSYFVFPEYARDPKQKVLQIETYGSVDRVHKGKTSQTMQFDYDSAKALYDILVREFEFN